ncbi:hypothetical protein ACHAXT_001210 [Thalassiosira profunda]
MSGSDRDVILIDSDDDGSCTLGGGARDGGEAPSLPEARRDSPSKEDANDGAVIDVDACIDLEEDGDGDDDGNSSSSSSSASSGIPSPWKAKSLAAMASDRPPSVIHTKSPTAQPAKTSGLSNESFHMDELSGTDMANARECSSEAKPPAKKPKQKKGRWGKRRKAAKSSDSTSCDSSVPSSIRSKSVAAHFHCYLLRSLNPDHPLKTYIGFTTHPQRRIRQHNGELKNAGAWRTKRAGRPWTFVCVVHGFADKIAALQFEWAWQNVHKSKAFRDAVGCDNLAKKMRRRYGPKARLDELRILLRECLPFSLYSLTVFFPEQEYHDIFREILSKNAKSSDDDGAGALLTNIEVCSLENMPVAKEAAALRAKKKAAREARKAQKQSKKKADDASNASDWPESASSMMDDESCWSDMLDNGDDGSASEPKRNFRLKTIGEIDSSIDLGSSSNEEDSSSSAAGSKEKRLDKDIGSADDISKDFMSLSLDASKKARRKDAKDGDDLSTISSDSQSECSLDADPGQEASQMGGKENRGSQNEQLDCSMKSPTKNGDASEDGSVVDLCSP